MRRTAQASETVPSARRSPTQLGSTLAYTEGKIVASAVAHAGSSGEAAVPRTAIAWSRSAARTCAQRAAHGAGGVCADREAAVVAGADASGILGNVRAR